MKKIITILIVFLTVLTCQAQKIYSEENLKTLSQEELEIYLNDAVKLQKTGKIVNIVGVSIVGGTVLTIATVAVTATDDWALGGVVIAFFGGLAGFGTLAVGIPINLTGKSRVKRINHLKKSAINNVSFGIQPCAQYNLAMQSYQPGIKLSINF